MFGIANMVVMFGYGILQSGVQSSGREDVGLEGYIAGGAGVFVQRYSGVGEAVQVQEDLGCHLFPTFQLMTESASIIQSSFPLFCWLIKFQKDLSTASIWFMDVAFYPSTVWFSPNLDGI